MKELIQQLDNIDRRVGKLEVQESSQSKGPWANRPTNPADGQSYQPTDTARKGKTYFWDVGASNWFSDIIFLTVGNRGEAMPFTQATHELDVALGGASTNGVYLVSVDAIFFPNTAQSGVNFYTFTIANLNVGFLTLTGTTDTKTFTTGSTWYKMPVGFSSPVLTSAAFGLAFVMTPTSAPGTFNFFITFAYRLIG